MTEGKKLGEGFVLAKMEVQRTVYPTDATGKKLPGAKGERELVGVLNVPVPTLKAFGIEGGAYAVDEANAAITDDYGMSVYASEAMQHIQACLRADIFVQHKNRLVPETIDLQDGKEFSSTIEEYLAGLPRDGSHLVNLSEAAKAFEAMIRGTGKSETISAQWKLYFRTPKAMEAQSANMKRKGQEYLASFAASLTPELLSKYQAAIVNCQTACAAETLSEDAY